MEGEGDTRFRKLFVGNLSYETDSIGLRNYFLQFGDVARAVVVNDRHGNSKGFGFVTFVNRQDAATALLNQFHIIDGRTVNCNLAAFPNEISQQSSRNRGRRMHFGGAVPHSGSNQAVTSNNPTDGPESINESATGNTNVGQNGGDREEEGQC